MDQKNYDKAAKCRKDHADFFARFQKDFSVDLENIENECRKGTLTGFIKFHDDVEKKTGTQITKCA